MFFIWYLLFAVSLVPLAASSNIDCGEKKFPCETGDQCVERKKWCDEQPDCRDKSDEAYCKKAWWFSQDPNDCFAKNDTLIFCGSGICIPLVAQCDGYKDCNDGYDEKYCDLLGENIKNETETIESSTSVKDYFPNKGETTITTSSAFDTSPLTSEVTNNHKEDKHLLITTTSTTRVAHSSRVNGYWPTVTDYYDKRMKEADSETKSKTPLISPKEIPTRAYVSNRSTFLPTQRLHTINVTKPTTPATPHSVSSRRPLINASPFQNAYPPRHTDQHHQTVNQRTNHYQPPINYYMLPSNHYQSSTNRYQPTSNHYQPTSNHYQPTSNHYQPTSNHYQPTSNHYQPTSNHYQPTSNHYESPTDHNQPQRPPSYTSYNEYRPLNGQPDARYQTNYFKPYTTELEVKRPFYFANDYGSLYGRDNARSIRDGLEWLLRQRSDSGDWGRDTPRAVVALSLSSNNSFFNGGNDDIIKRRFMVLLGADLIKNNTKNFNINRMFMAINGLLAVCEDPTDFHGIDLAEQLRHKIQDTRENHNRIRSYQSPFVSLSLCLSNKSLSSSEIHNLMKQMVPSVNMNERTKDTLIAAIMAFSCYIHRSSSEDTNYRTSLQSRLRYAVAKLLERVGEDGSFGSVYTTALAAQALMSTNESNSWNAAKTMSFLKQQQREDGSFGDFLATYLVLPALSGRSLLHLKNINCNPVKRELTPKEILEFAGPKQYVYYSLYFGYPLVNSQSLFLLLPKGVHFLDVMRVAEYQDQNFRFSLENNSSNVYSLSGLPNDPEMGLSWYLYVKHDSSPYLHEPNIRERFTGDLRSLSPESGETFIFWYHSNELQLRE